MSDAVTTHCSGCEKEMLVCEELAGCDIYCDDCPFPEDPCETCGKPECDRECCQCEYCVERRAALSEAGKIPIE